MEFGTCFAGEVDWANRLPRCIPQALHNFSNLPEDPESFLFPRLLS